MNNQDRYRGINEEARKDVLRIVRRDFPADQFAEAVAILDNYEPHMRLQIKVQLAILKLANGSIQDLQAALYQAKMECKDVLVGARGMNIWQHLDEDLSWEDREQLRELDAKQYHEWLMRE